MAVDVGQRKGNGKQRDIIILPHIDSILHVEDLNFTKEEIFHLGEFKFNDYTSEFVDHLLSRPSVSIYLGNELYGFFSRMYPDMESSEIVKRVNDTIENANNQYSNFIKSSLGFVPHHLMYKSNYKNSIMGTRTYLIQTRSIYGPLS